MEHVTHFGVAMLENDCGHPARQEFEDLSRTFGWGPLPGKGLCDYPGACDWAQAWNCPLIPREAQRDSEAAS